MPDSAAAAAEPRLRVFFALWPDAPTASRLHREARQLQRACGGRLMRQDTIHLTLAFLGDTPVSRLPALAEAAAQVQVPPCALVLDRCGNWHGNRVLWLGPSCPPTPLGLLAAQLGKALRERGFALEKRPFAPHVTVVRNALRPPAAAPVPAITWDVPAFVLVASERGPDGAHYREIGRWPLIKEAAN